MRILYFSWLRERAGASSESHTTNAKTVEELIAELRTLDQKYIAVFEDLSKIKVAVDQELVDNFQVSITGAREIAFFPPMTGG